MDDFVAGSDEEEEEGSGSERGGVGNMHMAMHLEHELGGADRGGSRITGRALTLT